VKHRDLVKKLLSLGYREVRNDGGHAIYEKTGVRSIQVPNHKELNEYTARQIPKDAGNGAE
jgi:mRNA interferase HicA